MKFSIIMPVYNAQQTLRLAVESVLQQCVDDFELIIIDDGSTDDSLTIMLALAAQDSRIRILSQSNGGVAAARNFGIGLARSKLIAFLDSDDIWRSQKLKKHLDFHTANPHVDGSYARIAFVDTPATANTKPMTTSSLWPSRLSLMAVVGENPVCTMSNLVVKQSCFGRHGFFKQDMSFAEDQEWLARAISNGAMIDGINTVLVNYRLSPDGLSVNLEKMYEGWQRLADAYVAPRHRGAAEAIYCRYLARRALRSGAPPRRAAIYVLKGLRLDASAFLGDAWRGWLTLISAFVAPFIPRAARLRLFA